MVKGTRQILTNVVVMLNRHEINHHEVLREFPAELRQIYAWLRADMWISYISALESSWIRDNSCILALKRYLFFIWKHFVVSGDLGLDKPLFHDTSR